MRVPWLAAPPPPPPLLLLSASVLLVLALAPPGEAHADATVPSDWPLLPPGIGPGDQFRMMFVTFGGPYTTDLQGNRSLDRLDDIVQNAVRHGHGALGPYADQFQVLASCGSTDARHHTSTTYTSGDRGVPVYWVDGDKVADDYSDFYDGSWDSLDARSQTGWSWDGSGYAAPLTWTGTNTDGTSSRNHVCTNPVTGGYADDFRPGEHFNSHVLDSRHHNSLYGLSSVFTVSDAPGAPSAPAVVLATHDSATIRWSAPTSHGATPIFDYDVQVRLAGGSWTGSTPYHWGTDTTHTLTELSPDTEYLVRVHAKNHGTGGSDIGYGPASPATAFRTLPSPIAVPDKWQLMPGGLGPGDTFRLLFVTSDTRNSYQPSESPQSYHQFVRDAAGNGHPALDQFGDDFRAVVSTRNASALDNAFMRYSSDNLGVPVYWLDGDRVADNYGDFYDGCWDSNDPRDENGDSVQGKAWTGANSDGTRSTNFIGHTRPNTGDAGVPCMEMDAGRGGYSALHHVYGISPIFKVTDD